MELGRLATIPARGSEDHHVHRLAADTLRAPFDPVVIGFARLVRALHVVHTVLDAGQLSRLQLALASVLHKRDVGCRGEWAAFNGADW